MSRILVVDDSAGTRNSLAKLLAHEGHVVQSAPNGREGWVTLYSGHPDLIVLDLMMPEMDGITFLRHLRQHHHWNEIPVAILTGHSDAEGLLTEAPRLGVSDVMLKGALPVNEMLKRINRLVPPPRKQRHAGSRIKQFLDAEPVKHQSLTKSR